MLLDHLSNLLVLEKKFLKTVINTASQRYKTYYIKKRKGGSRRINQPSKELKAIQRCVLDEVLCNLPVHDAATAYRKGIGLKENALRHVKNPYLLRIDLKNFFESITAEDLRAYLAGNSNLPDDWKPTDTELFIKLVCHNDKLTIGSVTSPSLSNALLYRLDSDLTAFCRGLDITYSRYADDMFFSTKSQGLLKSKYRELCNLINACAVPSNLKVNYSKTINSSKRNRRKVTGLVLTSQEKISIGRAKKREIKALIHQWDHLSSAEKRSLAGNLAHIQSVEPDFLNSLFIKYGAPLMTKAIKAKA